MYISSPELIVKCSRNGTPTGLYWIGTDNTDRADTRGRIREELVRPLWEIRYIV
jgi:hypothetical protein